MRSIIKTIWVTLLITTVGLGSSWQNDKEGPVTSRGLCIENPIDRRGAASAVSSYILNLRGYDNTDKRDHAEYLPEGGGRRGGGGLSIH